MSKKITDFKNFTDSESTRYLANHWPEGKVFAKKLSSDSIIYKFIKSLAVFIQIITGYTHTIAKNRDIQQADELLEEWETSVGIPTQIPRRDTTAGRRDAVQCLYRKIPVYNIDNKVGLDEYTLIENYIYCLTGITVTIRTGQVAGKGSDFPLEFPIQFGITAPYGNFVFIIEVEISGSPANNSFPLPFPVSFFDPTIPQATMELLDKVLERVIPSFGYWVYEAIIV